MKDKITVGCTSVNCPERNGGKCWFADGRTKQSRKVKKEWEEYLATLKPCYCGLQPLKHLHG